ncbi:hypothetical protein CON35_23015 [Bacillus cereus]|nr:hypothetical protein CON35_23015 [Bacillus cereus]
MSYVQYVCLGCAQTENIPDSVVKAFDVMDVGDSIVPPRFSCERCGKDMYPKDYTGIDGIMYNLSDFR